MVVEMRSSQHSAPATKGYSFDWKKKTNWQAYSELCEQIQSETSEPISLLVNNVEMYDVGKGKIEKTSDKDLLDCFNANIFPSVFMTRFLAPKMKS